ncbi:hypothetical protein BDN72DRAFT_841311 [Pluteus cervinus]|uniref:Uncharacterized protein n=1 Tax=Pluteus cervinus TaxID=181527 RepID=A0ACD3AU39_9AGAR|nr:hypothetical protein BDN72DRAFT_841311 [Pluteus cervinus]
MAMFVDRIHAERDRIDEEIRKLQGRILELCSARNQLAPVAQLPNEILTKIFCLARNATPPPCGWTSLTVSWVCRHWRLVALRFPHLWTIIDFPNRDWMEGFLLRSGQGALYINIPHIGPGALSAVPLFLLYLPRIVSLDLGASGRTYVCATNWDFTPAPNLQSLTLRNFTLSNNIFSGNYPSLRDLSLNTCVADWIQLPISSDLVGLHIINPASSTSTAILAGILGFLPKLEILELARTLLEEDGPGPNNLPRIPLLNLRTLKIQHEACNSALALFPRLSIPPSAQVSLLLRPEDPDEFSDTILAVQGCRLHPAWHISQLTFNVGNRLQILLGEACTDTRQFTWINFSFLLPSEIREELNTQNIMDICHSLHLANLQSFEIGGKLSPYDPGLWHTTLGNLPRLYNLKAYDHFARQFLRYLNDEAKKLMAAEQTNPLGSSQHRPAFRTLQSLVLANLRDKAPQYEDITRLRWALGPRKIYLERLPKLVLTVGSALPPEVIGSFGHVVGEFLQMLAPPGQGDSGDQDEDSEDEREAEDDDEDDDDDDD